MSFLIVSDGLFLEPGKPDSAVTLINCSADQPGRREGRVQPVRVKEVWPFKRNGRMELDDEEEESV